MRRWLGWRAVVMGVAATLALLLGVDDLPTQDRLALENALVLLVLGAAALAIWRVLYGDRPWQRRVQAWIGRPMTHWNDWRIIGLLGGIALGLYLLNSVDLPPADKWSSASVLLLLALCLAVQMINVAFLKRRGRK